MPLALSIAGSDPTGGAGLQADLQVFRSFGVHGSGVVSALTVQDTAKVHQVLPVFPSVVLDQLRIVLADLPPDAVKIGMLASDDVLRMVVLGLAALRPGTPVVLDPILLSSSGALLLERRAWPGLLEMFSLTTLITPNLPEAEALSGREAGTRGAAEGAARCLIEEHGAPAVLLKGGHRSGAPNDLLMWRDGDGLETEWLEGERIEGPAVHGTGCALSSAIAAELALGRSMHEAVASGRRYVADGIRGASALGKGAAFLGVPAHES